MTDAAERIHPASPGRREQARRAGDVARSRNLVSAAALLCGVYAVIHAGPGLMAHFERLFREHLGGRAWLSADSERVCSLSQELCAPLGGLLAPVFLALLLGTVASHLGQAGVLFVPQALVPRASRLSPGAALRRCFSLDHGFQAGVAAVQWLAVLGVALATLWSFRYQLAALGALTPMALAAVSLEMVKTLCVRIAWLLAAFGLADFAWQKWRYERRLRMTPEELREEQRQQAKGGRARAAARGR